MSDRQKGHRGEGGKGSCCKEGKGELGRGGEEVGEGREGGEVGKKLAED